MSGNATFSHLRTGVLSVEAVEAPEVITSAWIDEQLAETYARTGVRPGLLSDLAGIDERRWWPDGMRFEEAAALAGRRAIEASGDCRRRMVASCVDRLPSPSTIRA